MGGDLLERAAAAHEAGAHGVFRTHETVLSALDAHGSPAAHSWAAALRAQWWHADHAQGQLPDPADPVLFDDDGDEVAQSVAISHAVRASVLAWNQEALEEWSSRLRLVADRADSSDVAARNLLAQAWTRMAAGDHDEARTFADDARTVAANDGLAAPLVEATALSALCHGALGEIEDAVQLARTASRMSRAEDLPQSQYLASLVLARMRRLCGRPHLTARILEAMAPVAPAAWHASIAWELLMAGALSATNSLALDGNTAANRYATSFRALLVAASDGGDDRFRDALTQLDNTRPTWAGPAREAGAAVVVLDPISPLEHASDDVRPWIDGTVTETPSGLRGLCAVSDNDTDATLHAAFAIAVPGPGAHGCKARRIVGLAEKLANADVSLPVAHGASERTPATVAAIALSEDRGITRDALFQNVYGFPYKQAAHRGLFKTLMHRARTAVADAGTIEHDDERYYLKLERTLLIPDPRCEHPLEDIVLRILAKRGGGNAKATAEQLGVPLRTAQAAIKSLVDDGALSSKRVGRAVEYQVEDTTFSDPTRW